MSAYDPIQELSSSPYPEMSMPAVTAPTLAFEVATPALPEMRGSGWDFREDPGAGEWTFVYEEINSSNHAGHRFEGFFKDFYNRILFTPTKVSFGNILSTRTQGLDLWNGFLEAKEITDYVEPTVEGLTVTEPVSSPYTLSPLEEITYAVTVTTEGPPQFSENIEWAIDGEDYSTEVTGQRVLVWPFEPNWANSVSEKLSWLTDVMTAFDGTEQRVELRSKPRKEIEYTTTLHGNRVNVLKNLLFGWQNRKYALPLWYDKASIKEPLTVGDTSIPVKTVGRGFTDGGYGVLILDDFNFEVFEIDNVVDDSITLVSSIENDWPTHTRLYPVNLAFLPTSVSTTRPSSTTLSAQLSWQTDAVESDPYIPDLPAAETYDDYEVIYRKPNWAREPQDVAMYDYMTLDNETGPVQLIPKEEFPRQQRQYQWLIRNREDMADFRAMLGRMKGRNTPVYVPTWFADFYLYEVIGANSSTMKVKQQNFDFMVGVAKTNNTILVRLKDGTQYLRTIVDTGEGDDDYESINVDSPFPVEIQPKDVIMISLVHLMRLESDAVTINYQTDSVSTVELTMTTVEG